MWTGESFLWNGARRLLKTTHAMSHTFLHTITEVSLLCSDPSHLPLPCLCIPEISVHCVSQRLEREGVQVVGPGSLASFSRMLESEPSIALGTLNADGSSNFHKQPRSLDPSPPSPCGSVAGNLPEPC